MILEVFKFILKETIEYERAMLQFKEVLGIDPPPTDEVVQLARTTGLSLARAANRIYWKHALEGKIMGLKEERDFGKWWKAGKKTTKDRRKAQKEGVVCVICGKRYYDHSDYMEVVSHRSMATEQGKEQWVKKND